MLRSQWLRRYFFGLMLCLFTSLACAAAVDWSGDWDSTWRDRGARISLTQKGDQVSGGYRLYGGTVEGTANGRELQGQWYERGRQGTFLAVMSADGKTFTARFGTGEWLTAIRVEDDNEFLGKQFDRSSAAMVMHHFLSVMNAVGPGRMELLSEASQFIDFALLTSEQVSELEYTQTLFAVLDRLTFRVWGVQPKRGEEGKAFTALLPQEGSDVKFELGFIKRDEQWFIDPPPFAQLKNTLTRLERARERSGSLENQALSSPRETLRTLVRAFDGGDSGIEIALSTLNLSELSALAREYEAPRLARYINRALQRLGSLTWQEVPDDPNRSSPYVHFEHPLGAIALGPVATEDGTIWKFTPETLQTIRAVYAALDNIPRNELLYLQLQKESLYFRVRDGVRNLYPGLVSRLGPMEIWQWLGLLVVLCFAFLAGRILEVLLYALLMSRYQSRAKQAPVIRWLYLWSFRGLALGIMLRLSDRILSFPDLVQVVLVAISLSATIISSTVLMLLLIGLVVDRLKAVSKTGTNNITLVAFVAGIIRVVIVLSAILLLADVLQVPYQSVLAGLGLGGLAVALAAQSTLQNFISGITLYFDKPIAVGDYCRFGDKTGTIEFIGMRSTRIRTLDRTVLTIPNSEFSNMQIENYAKRDSMFLNSVIRLRYETTPDQLRYLLAELRKLLLSHPKVASDPLRVRFDGFGTHSLDVSIFAYVMSSDYAEFVAIREDIYLRIMQLIEASGNKLAVPSMLHYNARDTLPDKDQVAASEAQVEQWRQEGKLPFPDYSWQDKAEFRDRLDYPPEGSILSDHGHR